MIVIVAGEKHLAMTSHFGGRGKGSMCSRITGRQCPTLSGIGVDTNSNRHSVQQSLVNTFHCAFVTRHLNFDKSCTSVTYLGAMMMSAPDLLIAS